ncbi:hypothetical protein G7K_3539-t1 [Saitoella complicata NRRL Y-17804]|uniref:Uncharacterized protein n=1 Tax=Saitoella complicata (strain BCRC 22490 / CBS 7301 / JCM 7358 / NBRC 10748 / NRRL Y-17804) TaxID=698492 RepID=A0A0E9NHS8_SAICN|nr:hypothetical protein G7K_3539-t1 [Saitoella complicata NRRL Y-17804]
MRMQSPLPNSSTIRPLSIVFSARILSHASYATSAPSVPPAQALNNDVLPSLDRPIGIEIMPHVGDQLVGTEKDSRAWKERTRDKLDNNKIL